MLIDAHDTKAIRTLRFN